MELTSISEFFEKKGNLCQSGSNYPLLLQGSENVWFLKSGCIDVFSVQAIDGEVQGARTYIFSVTSGNIFIGMDSDDTISRSFLAVGNSDVTVYRVNMDELQCFLHTTGQITLLSHLIDKWLLSITAGTARDCSLRYDLAIEKSEIISIPQNNKIRALKGVLWLRITKSSITFLDNEVDEFEGDIYFPLTENSWCLTISSFGSAAIPTEEIITNNQFFDYLKYYHRQVLVLEELNVRMQLVDDFVRNKEKIGILKQIDKEAYYNIAGVLDEKIKMEERFTSSDSLLEACKILCDYLGIRISEPQIDLKKKDITLDDISRSSKFQYRKISLSEDWWQSDSGPMLTFTKDTNNPVILISDIAGRYNIKIPAEKINTRVTQNLAARIEDYAFTFYKPFPFEKVSPSVFLNFIFNSCKKELALLLTAGSIGGLLTVFIPILTGIIVDTIIPQSDKLKLYGFGLAVVFSVFAIIFAQILRSISYIRLDTKIDYLIQSALWDRLINLPVSFFKKFSSGQLAAKANSISYLKQMLTYSVINIIIYDVFMVFNLFLLFYYNLLLGFLSFALFSIYLLIVIKIGVKLKKQNYSIIQYENSINSMVNQVLNSISKIRIAGVEKLAFKLWTDKYSMKQKENVIVKNSSKQILVLNSVFPAFAVIFIFYLLTSERYSYLSAGILISFFTAFKIFMLSLVQISNAGVLFFMAAPLYENSKEILYSLPEYSQAEGDIKELKGEIEISHAWFRYSAEGKYVLSDISMSVKPGEFIAIVGASGSGKSTLLRLLLGFESPETGTIYFDKHNIESINKSNLRRQIGTVLQNSRLFPGNIYSNIAGVHNITITRVNEIARTVGLDDDLKTMPMGVFTVINEGVSTLSGGQRQKILLAKALVDNPSVLLLDEATSALDNEAQKVISDNLAKIQATRIIVAHRLSTVRDADRIYVLEKGTIAECGNYDELMHKNGKFAELVKRQLADN